MPLELLQFLISLEKGFLHGLFGIFRIVSHILGDPEQLTIVSLDELLGGGNIATADRVHESQISVWRVCLRKLCAVFNRRRVHKHLVVFLKYHPVGYGPNLEPTSCINFRQAAPPKITSKAAVSSAVRTAYTEPKSSTATGSTRHPVLSSRIGLRQTISNAITSC